MPRFIARELQGQAHAGEALQAARTGRYLSVAQVARKLNMPLKYLEALEGGEWDVLPRGDYGRYFLRQYASFLNLPVDEMMRQYPGPNTGQLVQPPQRPVKSGPTPIVHPVRRMLYVGAAAGVIVYLIFAAWSTLLPPKLQLISPASDVTTSQAQVTVRGVTKPGITVTINGVAADVTEAGNFAAAVPLTVGLNDINVVAKKPYSRPVSLTRRVLFVPAVPGPGVPSLVP